MARKGHIIFCTIMFPLLAVALIALGALASAQTANDVYVRYVAKVHQLNRSVLVETFSCSTNLEHARHVTEHNNSLGTELHADVITSNDHDEYLEARAARAAHRCLGWDSQDN